MRHEGIWDTVLWDKVMMIGVMMDRAKSKGKGYRIALVVQCWLR
jgi:hypothetical protein